MSFPAVFGFDQSTKFGARKWEGAGVGYRVGGTSIHTPLRIFYFTLARNSFNCPRWTAAYACRRSY